MINSGYFLLGIPIIQGSFYILGSYIVCIVTGDDTPEAHDTNTHVVPYCAEKWRELGEALGFSPSQLNIINVDNPSSCEERCKVMLRKWVQQNLSATWGKLVDAAKAIHSVHCALPNSNEGM